MASSTKRKFDAHQDFSIEENGVTHHYHFIPSPTKKRRRRYPIGTAYKGCVIQPIVYEGASNTPATPVKARSRAVIQPSPGHQQTISNSLPGGAFGAADEGWEDIQEEDIREDSCTPGLPWLDSRTPLLGSTAMASHPQWEKWKEISADHWKHLIPTLVRPFMRWCQEMSYGRHEGSQHIIPLNCKCGKSACRVEVTAVYMDCEFREYNASFLALRDFYYQDWNTTP
ncbi:hypothetical protein BS47DRAFT_1401778 [Hydnum rufescens UP504]|uniref:Uncharacterized protein n=1 Tax=Hydnum rufescens UP504 TaxID=1448309 RepID=A0A9P6ADT2_9AGAM|nr:hypothetical protein BS47DRAFT_1401778 [Hydnum rufescens UP504]